MSSVEYVQLWEALVDLPAALSLATVVVASVFGIGYGYNVEW